MKKVYIVLTHTGTVLSKIVRGYTKDEVSHCSISLDKDLTQMYSFGRLHPSNPFFGGFVHEYIDKGTFKRFYKTVAKIYSLEVEDEQFDKIKNIIYDFEKNKTKYKFNIIGLLAIGFNIRIKMKNGFYCAEFVKYVLEQAGIDTKLPEMVRPENFKDLKNMNKIYEGLLQEYKMEEFSVVLD